MTVSEMAVGKMTLSLFSIFTFSLFFLPVANLSMTLSFAGNVSRMTSLSTRCRYFSITCYTKKAIIFGN